MAVSVQFEIGHTAKLRAKKTPEGFTHEWDLYVQGSNKADISAYVEKVVFNLHESFQRPKRVFKEPPYTIHESGYAGFTLNIDIYFRNRDEPKRVQYTYDLDLQQHGPPHHHSEEKKFVFESPSEEFRQKLLKGGGVPVVPVGLAGSRNNNQNVLPNSFVDSSSALKHKSSSSAADSSSKKHKSRIDDSKLNTFANLFGTPDAGMKNSNSSASNSKTDALKNSSNSSGTKIYSPSSSATSSVNSISGSSKDKSNKEGKEKSSSGSNSAEKSKDKSERKEKHKSSSSTSPSKDGRMDSKKSLTSTQAADAGTGGSSKSDKRNEDKPKKDKTRDKDRDRNRGEPNSSGTPSSGSMKSSSSSKANNNGSLAPNATQQFTANALATGPAAQRTPTHATGSSSSGQIRTDDKGGSSTAKSEKETKEKHSSSSSSGKKSKKEKKDKDKDKERDKEKRNEDKQRNSGNSNDTKLKEERPHSNSSMTNLSSSPSGHSTPNLLSTTAQVKQPQLSNSGSSRKLEKEAKNEATKTKSSTEKAAEKQVTTTAITGLNSNSPVPGATATSVDKKSALSINSNTSSAGSGNNTKTHKHKKKDRNKEKDRSNSGGGAEKEKDKSKEKKEKEKLASHSQGGDKFLTTSGTKPATAAVEPAKKPVNASQINNSSLPPATTSQLNNIVGHGTVVDGVSSSKKSQNKEKKSKDSKSNKDSKRRAESTISGEPKSKTSKTSTPLSTAGSNIELSDADSRQSAHESLKANPMAAVAANIGPETVDLQSDNSCTSFPDAPAKQSEKPVAQTVASPDKTIAPSANSKENKQREKDKSSSKSAEKSNKSEKEEKKRRRNTVTAANNTTFVEPPLKQAKKDQSKSVVTVRDTSVKSPLPRNNSGGLSNTAGTGRSNSKTQADTNVQEADNAATAGMLSSTVSPTNTAHSTVATNHTNSVPNSIPQQQQQQRSTTHPASPALINTSTNETIWPNLGELQELHHKIMTLQDNDDLQQVVEMIAASGCYEVTQRTFDFDLCKLDRGTVERLQEFFATSVS